MSYETIRYETRDAVALLTLNRPDRLNAWTPHMASELAAAIEVANEDVSVGAIVMTGEGRGFCAGADMEDTFKTRIEGDDPGNDTQGGQGGMPADVDWVGLVRRSKPLVAAVNGAAVGIGMTMILPFDVIVASEKAKFGMLFIKMGLVPELASSYYLVQRMGFGPASEMCLTGRLYEGEEAARLGLADHLTSPDRVVETAMAVASQMADNPAPQLRMIKELLSKNGGDPDFVAVQDRESELLRICWETPEHSEAVSAFLEKRPAKFR